MSSPVLHWHIVGGHVGERTCPSAGVAGKDHLWLEADEVDEEEVEEDEVEQPQLPVTTRVHPSSSPQSKGRERGRRREGGNERAKEGGVRERERKEGERRERERREGERRGDK